MQLKLAIGRGCGVVYISSTQLMASRYTQGNIRSIELNYLVLFKQHLPSNRVGSKERPSDPGSSVISPSSSNNLSALSMLLE